MYRLIVDTATSFLYLALLRNDILIRSELKATNKDAAAQIFLTLDVVLGDVKLAEIEEVIVGIGPGSFTGVRIALSFAKILTLNKTKIYKISSLSLFSSGYNNNYVAYLDARNGNCYALVYSDKYLVKDEFLVLEDLKKQYKDFKFVTDGDFNVSIKRILEEKEEVLDPLFLEPNYIRIGINS